MTVERSFTINKTHVQGMIDLISSVLKKYRIDFMKYNTPCVLHVISSDRTL